MNNNLFRRIMMVISNDYRKGLYNGDTGFVQQREDGSGQVIINVPEGGGRRFELAGFASHETAFAMTVHKSQGSEYNRVLIVLPEHLSPVVTRQLLYTGVTRAREHVLIAGEPQMIRQALEVSVEHHSGLGDTLESRLMAK